MDILTSASTSIYPNEMSWTLTHSGGETCSGSGYSSSDVETSCCLPLDGSSTLVCSDSYGDGWNGGFLMIAGAQYCSTFSAGFSETHTVNGASFSLGVAPSPEVASKHTLSTVINLYI
jgi:hypothetical protein